MLEGYQPCIGIWKIDKEGCLGAMKSEENIQGIESLRGRKLLLEFYCLGGFNAEFRT